MGDLPLPSIVSAFARGRGRRGWKSPARWIDDRSQLLSQLYVDTQPAVIQEQLHISASDFERQIAEACDAILRGRADSQEADVVCAPIWQRWCKLRDTPACTR